MCHESSYRICCTSTEYLAAAAIDCMRALTGRCSISHTGWRFTLGVVGAPRRFLWQLPRTSFPLLDPIVPPCSLPLANLSSGRATSRHLRHGSRAMSDSETVRDHSVGHDRPNLEPGHHSGEPRDARSASADHRRRQFPVSRAGCFRGAPNGFASVHVSYRSSRQRFAQRWSSDPYGSPAASRCRTLLHLALVPDSRDGPRCESAEKLRLLHQRYGPAGPAF